MGERFNLCLVGGGVLRTNERITLLGKVFSRSESILGHVVALGLNNISTHDFIELQWTGEIEDLPEPTRDSILHFTLDDHEGGQSVVTMQQERAAFVVTVSTPRAQRKYPSVNAIERAMADLFTCNDTSRRAILVAGFELEASADGASFDQIVSNIFQETSLIVAAMGPPAWVPRDRLEFPVSHPGPGYVLVWHRFATERLLANEIADICPG